MNQKKQIHLAEICLHYSIDESFIIDLNQHDLIVLARVENKLCIHEDDIVHLEKFIRLKNELNINPEGLDVIINLLSRIEKLEEELRNSQERLSIYE